jgi:DMATS type aromatic prenyltransferase
VPQVFFAVDLHGADRSLKTYMYPTSKATATGRTTVDIAFESIKRLEPHGESFGPALEVIREYFGVSLEPLQVDCLALDCVDPAGARVKIYAQAKLNNFNAVEHVATFGGKRTDDVTLRGLEKLHKVWHLILNEPRIEKDKDFEAPLVDPTSRYKALLYSWELRQGQLLPDFKIYIHLWHYVKNNNSMLENWETIFKVNGWEWGAKGEYRALIEDALWVPISFVVSCRLFSCIY